MSASLILNIIKAASMLFDLWVKWSNRKKAADEVELTTGQQKAHGKIINAINKQERTAKRNLDTVNSLRKRADEINKLKNTDV